MYTLIHRTSIIYDIYPESLFWEAVEWGRQALLGQRYTIQIFLLDMSRFFVSTEAATTSTELAELIGLHVGLNLALDLTKAVVRYFSEKSSSLLILDNLETVWEPLHSRAGVEEFLSLLSHVENLALMEIDKVLKFTSNMPLAVDLIAHLADYEGLSNHPLYKITILCLSEAISNSAGADRRSNLDVSIRLSLSSPRINSHSRELLSVLSILPNGLSDAELVQINFGITNILSCKAALQATSLVYRDSNQRILLLTPKYHGEQLLPVVTQITLNLANVKEVLQRGLYLGAPSLADMIYCVLSLNRFYRVTGRDHTVLMDSIQPVFPCPPDHQLETEFLTEVLKTGYYKKVVSEAVMAQAITKFDHITDVLLECDYTAIWNNASAAKRLSKLSANFYQEANANQVGAACSRYLGKYKESAAQLLRARELVALCGLSGGDLDHDIALGLAEIYLVKSEYAEARSGWRAERAEIRIAKIKFQEFLQSTWGIHDEGACFCPEQLANINAWPASGSPCKWPMVYLAYAYKSQLKLALHKALLFIGDTFNVNQDEITAANLHGIALIGFTSMDIHQSRAECMLRLGDLAISQGHTSEAITLWITAQPLFERSLQAAEVAQINSRIMTVKKELGPNQHHSTDNSLLKGETFGSEV
ncbi:hypothetical protein K438DRAFT_1773072 [Mycena galopus ATCC 62051]|nr:hypothetical protein K438DRAFT_1773072 [Mycena galopus ATCC 62051]